MLKSLSVGTVGRFRKGDYWQGRLTENDDIDSPIEGAASVAGITGNWMKFSIAADRKPLRCKRIFNDEKSD